MITKSRLQNFRYSWSSKGPGRTLLSAFGRLGFSLPLSRALSRLTKIILNPVDYISRRVQVGGISRKAIAQIPREDGYLFLDDVHGLEAVQSHCDAIFLERKKPALSATKVPHSLFNFSKTPTGPSSSDIEAMKPLVDFLCQPALAGMAAEYIGEIPVIGNISLWWSNTGSERLGPQLIHRDMNQKRQLHLIIPIYPIDEENGPFTFLPADLSRDFIKETGHFYGRIEDSEFKHLKDMIPFTSNKGSALIVNPYDCFHFGGRAATKPRFVLICSYTSKFESAEEGQGTYRLVNRAGFGVDSSLRRKLLDL